MNGSGPRPGAARHPSPYAGRGDDSLNTVLPSPNVAGEAGGGGRAPFLDLVWLARLAWSELPLLAAIDLLLTLGAAVVAVVAVTVAPLAPFAAAVVLGPVWLGATAVCLRLLAGEALGLRDLLASVAARTKAGIGLALVPGTIAALLLGSLVIKPAGNAGRWMLIPLAADALALVVFAFGCLTVFPLAVLTPVRGRERWRVALALAGRHVVASAGLLALSVLLALSIRFAGAVLALALAGPYCLLVTATVGIGMLGLPTGDAADGER